MQRRALLQWVVLVIAAIAAGCSSTQGVVSRGAGAANTENQVYLCQDSQVVLIDVKQARTTPTAMLWSWKAQDSSDIPQADGKLFEYLDECKPVMHGQVLAVSSSFRGGIALIRKSDKKCIFYARGANPHSLDVISDELVAAAFSGEKGYVALFDRKAQPLEAKPIWQYPLPWGHGVVWDRHRQVLWALGDEVVLKIRINSGRQPVAEVVEKIKLPEGGGHDLFPYDRDNLAISTENTAHLLNADTLQVSSLQELAGKAGLKSISRNPRTGLLMFTQAEGDTSFATKLQFACEPPLPLPYPNIYKARWNSENAFNAGR